MEFSIWLCFTRILCQTYAPLMPPYAFLLCPFLCPYAPPIPPMYLPMASMSLPMALLCFPPMSPLLPPHALLCPLCPFSCTFQCPHSPSISSCPYALSCFPFMPLSPWMSPPIHPMLNYAQHTYPMLFLCPHVHFYNPYAPPIIPFMLHVSCTPCVPPMSSTPSIPYPYIFPLPPPIPA